MIYKNSFGRYIFLANFDKIEYNDPGIIVASKYVLDDDVDVVIERVDVVIEGVEGITNQEFLDILMSEYSNNGWKGEIFTYEQIIKKLKENNRDY